MANSYQIGTWSHGLCNCFDNVGICIVSWLLPCVQFGQNAEKVGAGSCILCGFLHTVPLVNIVAWMDVRGRIREQHAIDGTVVNDCLTIVFCPLCALVQEGQQLDSGPSAMSMSRE